MHTSTSPQYGLIASLDVARKQAVMEGYKLLVAHARARKEVRELINSTKVFRVLELEDLLPEEVQARRHPPRSDQGDDRHLGLRLHRRGPAEGAVRALQHPGREVDLQHADPAAHHRHHALQGLAPVRRADAHRARGAPAAAAGADARDPALHPAALPAARRLLLRRRADAGVRRARARQPQARRARLRRPDRALPARHSGAGARAS